MCSVSAPRGGHRTGCGLAGWPVGDLLEAEVATAILDGKIAGLVLAHQHAALGGSVVAALALQLKQLAFVAHHTQSRLTTRSCSKRKIASSSAFEGLLRWKSASDDAARAKRRLWSAR